MKHHSFIVCFILLYSISSVAQIKKSEPLPIIDLTNKVNFGYKESDKRNIDIIVIHSTYYLNADSFSLQGVLKQFRSYNVSSHYIIGRSGNIYRLVQEKNISYHAGNSVLPGTNRKNINSTSIGIEIINTPYSAPTDEQYQSLLYLVQDIRNRHKIKHIVRHSDIAPNRKTDPWAFNWDIFNRWLNNSSYK